MPNENHKESYGDALGPQDLEKSGVQGVQTDPGGEIPADVADQVRMKHQTLSANTQAQVDAIKTLGAKFILLMRDVGHSRETSLAITKIEEAVMWAVKGATLPST